MAPAQPRQPDPKSDQPTNNNGEAKAKTAKAKPATKADAKADKKLPRRPRAGVKEPHHRANKRRGVPQPDFDLAVSAVVESKLAAAGWGKYEFPEAIGTTYDRVYRPRSGRQTWPAWLLHNVAHGLGTTVDAILILAGLEQPRSSLRQAIESSRELDDISRDDLLARFETLIVDTQQRRRLSRGDTDQAN